MLFGKQRLSPLSRIIILLNIYLSFINNNYLQQFIHNAQDKYHIDVRVASMLYRAVIKGKTYHSKAYQRTKVRNSYSISYIDDDAQKYGFIHYFLSLTSFSIAVITSLTQNLSVLCKCLVPVVIESSVVIVSKSLLN